jgi:hypothetical protein
MIGAIRVRPTASDTSVSVGDSITLRVGADFLKGVVFDVQRRRNGGDWVSVRSDTFDPTPTFRLTRAGTYEFRARTELYLQGKRSQWSPIRAVSSV